MVYNQSGKIVLTGNKDVDYQILNQLDIQDLSKLCRTNKYTRELDERLMMYNNTKISQQQADTLKFYDIQYKNSDTKPVIDTLYVIYIHLFL